MPPNFFNVLVKFIIHVPKKAIHLTFFFPQKMQMISEHTISHIFTRETIAINNVHLGIVNGDFFGWFITRIPLVIQTIILIMVSSGLIFLLLTHHHPSIPNFICMGLPPIKMVITREYH